MKFAPPEQIAAHAEWRRRYPYSPPPFSDPQATDESRAEFLAILRAAERGETNLENVGASPNVTEAVRLLTPLLTGPSPTWQSKADLHNAQLTHGAVQPPPVQFSENDLSAIIAGLPAPTSTEYASQLAERVVYGGGGAVERGAGIASGIGLAGELIALAKNYMGGISPQVLLSNVIGFRNLLIAKGAPKAEIELFNKAVSETAMWYHRYFEHT